MWGATLMPNRSTTLTNKMQKNIYEESWIGWRNKLGINNGLL